MLWGRQSRIIKHSQKSFEDKESKMQRDSTSMAVLRCEVRGRTPNPVSDPDSALLTELSPLYLSHTATSSHTCINLSLLHWLSESTTMKAHWQTLGRSPGKEGLCGLGHSRLQGTRWNLLDFHSPLSLSWSTCLCTKTASDSVVRSRLL